MMEADKKQELVQIQLGPENQGRPRFWRSLDELNQSESFERERHREFSAGGGVLDEVSRRGFFKLLGASAAVATMAGCTKLPIEAIVPYVVQPEEIIPGKPLFFATNMEYGGYAQALLARSNEG